MRRIIRELIQWQLYVWLCVWKVYDLVFCNNDFNMQRETIATAAVNDNLNPVIAAAIRSQFRE